MPDTVQRSAERPARFPVLLSVMPNGDLIAFRGTAMVADDTNVGRVPDAPGLDASEAAWTNIALKADAILVGYTGPRAFCRTTPWRPSSRPGIGCIGLVADGYFERVPAVA